MREGISPPFPNLLTALAEQGSDRARVFAAILSGQAGSRRDVAELLSLRSTSVSGSVAELLDLQLLAETGGPRVGRGRPSQILVASTNSLVTLVFHVISQSLHVVAINLTAQVLFHEHEAAEKDCDNAKLIEKFRLLQQRITARIPKTTRIAGIAFSLSGLIDVATKEWIFSSRWPAMHHLALSDIFPDMSCPVAISRNMDSELRARLYREKGSALLLHWGYGIGAAFGTPAGHVVTGSDGFGEVGHWHINGEAAPCRCGRHGCLETTAALWALGPNLMGERFHTGHDEEHLAAEIQALDLSHRPEIDKALHQVIIALGNLCRVFFPHKLIVSGPMMANATLWARFREEFVQENAFIDLPQPELVLGQHSRHYELLGAAGPIFEKSLKVMLGDGGG